MSPVEEPMIRKLRVDLSTKLWSSCHWKWPENTIYDPLSINSFSLYRNPIWHREKFSFYDGLAEAQGGWSSCFDVAQLENEELGLHLTIGVPGYRFMTTVLTTCLAKCVVTHSPWKHCKNCSPFLFHPQCPLPCEAETLCSSGLSNMGIFQKKTKPNLPLVKKKGLFLLLCFQLILFFCLHIQVAFLPGTEKKKKLYLKMAHLPWEHDINVPSCVYYSLRNMGLDFS